MCPTCKELTTATPTEHFSNISRGGLIQPSQELLQGVDLWLLYFKSIISKQENKFITEHDQRSILCSTLYLASSTMSLQFHSNDAACIKHAIFTFSNISLKNVAKLYNRKNDSIKISKARQIKKLSSE